ncbi:hypothetical protein ANCCEY_09504 [Ancylostoma ceylanicum]|uniref:C-type lectin domain-containing protein n=1 Tax=Ancylostoma ceylanicum TaxID=53326 RepID=A0A0D6LJS1_9BILA|nr:hypothetical protein ANCCEY_09504 [Ancylostoma ceylanicum]
MISRFLYFFCLCAASLQLPARTDKRLCCGKIAPTANQNIFKAQSDPRVIYRERINWDYKNFTGTAIEKKPFNITFTRRCPDSWLRFRDSCYFIEKTRMELSDAESSCYEKGATLFTANSLEEFVSVTSSVEIIILQRGSSEIQDVVMRSAALNFWSWTGLVQFDTMTQPKWLSYGGVEPTRLKWLVSPYTSASNGRTAASECVAYYNSELESRQMSSKGGRRRHPTACTDFLDCTPLNSRTSNEEKPLNSRR